MSDGFETWACLVCGKRGPGDLPVGHGSGVCAPLQETMESLRAERDAALKAKEEAEALSEAVHAEKTTLEAQFREFMDRNADDVASLRSQLAQAREALEKIYEYEDINDREDGHVARLARAALSPPSSGVEREEET